MLHRALMIARMGYWKSIDRQSSDLWLSSELLAIYGMAPGHHVVSMAEIRSHYLGDAPAQLKAAYFNCWETGEPYVVEGSYIGPGGEISTFAVYGEVERDPAGAIIGVSGIVKDVTEERAALAQVANSEQRLKDFVSTASDWCWETDAGHRFVDLSTREDWARGNQRTRISGHTRRDLPIVPEDLAKMDAHFRDLDARRPFRDFIYSYFAPDREGGRCSVRSSGKPIFDADGTFLGYRGTASDITDLRHAEDLLNQRTMALREAHRMGKIGTWSYRLGCERVTLADECVTVFGLDPATFDPTHANVLACFGVPGADRVVDIQREAIRTGTTQAIDVQIVRPDGSAADLALTCKPEIDATGEAVGIIGTVQDISERKEAQRQLERSPITTRSPASPIARSSSASLPPSSTAASGAARPADCCCSISTGSRR